MNVYVRDVSCMNHAIEAMRLSFGSVSNGLDRVSDKGYTINKDDYTLLKKLIVAGDSHAKVTRMIQVWLDLTLPRYIWSEFDTYKVGTTAMSESSVHTLLKEIKEDRLDLSRFEYTKNTEDVLRASIYSLKEAVATGCSIEEVKQLLPESFLQRRIVNLNYQTLRHIYFDRRNHRLQSWHVLLDRLLEQLPFNELITVEKEV